MNTKKVPVEVSASTDIICSLCKSSQSEIFFSLPDMPTQDGILASSPEEALKVTKGDILLSYCHNCGAICNEGHQADKISFDIYDFSLAHSPVFRDYVDETTDYLIEKYDLKGEAYIRCRLWRGIFFKRTLQKRWK